jgi:hypothetical protein
LIVKTTMSLEGIFKLTSRTFVGDVNLPMANSQVTDFLISVGNWVPNRQTKFIEVLQQDNIAVQEHVIIVSA